MATSDGKQKKHSVHRNQEYSFAYTIMADVILTNPSPLLPIQIRVGFCFSTLCEILCKYSLIHTVGIDNINLFEIFLF